MNTEMVVRPEDTFTLKNATDSVLRVSCIGQASGMTLIAVLPPGGSIRLERLSESLDVSHMAIGGPEGDDDMPANTAH